MIIKQAVMAVTNDKFELSVYIADSYCEMARFLKTDPSSVSRAANEKLKTVRKLKIVRVNL